jgi:hypothetical protein
MSFKEQFLALKPGPQREKLIYDTIIARGKPKDSSLVPVTVALPNGSKLTYKVLPDFLQIDGIRVPVTGVTAQRIANAFGMSLPTAKMSKQIWDAADTKLAPQPMSAGGNINGKYYSGQEVVSHKISDSDTSVAFNDRINNQLAGKTPALVAGSMKDIVAPDKEGHLGLYGLYHTNGKAIQNSAITPHSTHDHTEYASGVRLVSGDVTITNPDGSKQTKKMDEVFSDPNFGKALSNTGLLNKYKTDPKDQPAQPVKEDTTSPLAQPLPAPIVQQPKVPVSVPSTTPQTSVPARVKMLKKMETEQMSEKAVQDLLNEFGGL